MREKKNTGKENNVVGQDHDHHNSGQKASNAIILKGAHEHEHEYEQNPLRKKENV
jgi:hypothetical protein